MTGNQQPQQKYKWILTMKLKEYQNIDMKKMEMWLKG